MGLGGTGLEGLTSGSGGGGGGVPDSPLILQAFGVVGAPELAFLGDEDTGLYRPAADQLGLVAGGVEAARLTEVGGHPTLTVDPGDAGTGAATLSFGAGGSGIRQSGTDLFVVVGGASKFAWSGNLFVSQLAGGAGMLNETASAVNPTLVPNRGDLDTGIGWNAADALSIVAGGVEGIRVAEGEGAITSSFNGVFKGFNAAGPLLFNRAATSIAATLLPNSADLDTGIGWNASDQLSVIAGGVELLRASETGNSDTDQILLPRDGAEATPALALGSGDRGFWSGGVAQINASIGGTRVQFFSSSGFTQTGSIGVALAAGPRMLNETPSATNPVINVRQNDSDSGLGSGAADQVDLIAGGLSCMAVRETAAARQIGFYTTAPISLQTGVAVTDVAIHAALVALGLITA